MKQQKNQKQVAFAFLLGPGKLGGQAVLLAESLRIFGGNFKHAPLCAFIPQNQASVADSIILKKLSRLEVSIHQFYFEPKFANFPFSRKVFASAQAEQLAKEDRRILVWMDTDSFFIQEPGPLVIQDDLLFGYRPVDHMLIGSPYNQSLDAFWQLIYRHCEIPCDHVFSMVTSQDEQCIRPYFNAGLLVLRPEFSLLKSWARNFTQLIEQPELQPFFAKKHLHWIFFHQAVLAGTILGMVKPDQMFELPRLVNYPLHMHQQYPLQHRPQSLSELITARYDTFFDKKGWEAAFMRNDQMVNWLIQHLG